MTVFLGGVSAALDRTDYAGRLLPRAGSLAGATLALSGLYRALGDDHADEPLGCDHIPAGNAPTAWSSTPITAAADPGDRRPPVIVHLLPEGNPWSAVPSAGMAGKWSRFPESPDSP